MKIDRRSFIGSILGTLVVRNILFMGMEANYKKLSKKSTIVAKANSFIAPDGILARYRALWIFDNGEKIWQPPVVKVERPDELRVRLIFEGLSVKQTMTSNRVQLVNERGVLLSETEQRLYAHNGDLINLAHTLIASDPFDVE